MENLPSPLSVRYFWEKSDSVPNHIDGEGLKSELSFAQSALLCGVAENSNQHCTCRSHAIFADAMRVTLKRQLHITMTKQSLYGFWIGLNADEKRCQTMTQIVEAESSRVIIYQFAFVVSVRN